MIRLLTTTSIGKKIVMALTGLGAIGFLVIHLVGNLMVYEGRDASNAYAHFLHSVPFLGLIELGLFALFAIHIIFGVALTVQNWKARPVGYSQRKPVAGTSIFSSTMIYSGTLVLVFMLLHIWTMDFGHILHEGVYDKTIRVLGDPQSAVLYTLALIALGFHLFHGAESAFQSLGFKHPKYESFLVGVCRVGVVLLVGAFLSIPVYVWLLLKGGATP